MFIRGVQQLDNITFLICFEEIGHGEVGGDEVLLKLSGVVQVFEFEDALV